MEHVYLVLLFFGGCTLAFGIARLRACLGCTEMVTARILSVYQDERTRHTKSGMETELQRNNVYQLEFDYSGKTYTIRAETEAFLGNATEETVIHINPNHPERYRTPTNRLHAILTIALGALLLVLGGIAAWVTWSLK